MSVRLSPGLEAALARPETLRILVRAAPGRALPVAQALHSGLARFGAVHGIHLTEPVPVPLAGGSAEATTGAIFIAGAAHLDQAQVREFGGQFPGWAAEVDGGADGVELDLAPRITERWLTLIGFAPAVRASMRTSPIVEPGPAVFGRSVAALATSAAEWLTPPGTGPDDELVLYLYGADFPLDGPGTVASAVSGAAAASDPVVVLRSDFTTQVRAATVSGGPRGLVPEATLTWAGALRPEPSEERSAALVAAMAAQRDLLRRHHAALAWGQVAIVPNLANLLLSGWDQQSTPQHREYAPFPSLLGGVSIPAPSWYQVLSAGHLDRLGGPPSGAVELAPDRFELTIGSPEQWLPGHSDGHQVRADAAELLAAVLLDEHEAMAEYRTVAQQILQGHGRA